MLHTVIARLPLLSVAAIFLAMLAGCGSSPPPKGQPAPPGSAGLAAGRDVLTREQIQQLNKPSMERLLDGRFPGVQVVRRSGELTLRIRGGGEPLLVLNGMPASPALLWSLDPVDVERIEIVKETSAAIYGVEGANGVVLITTR
jgi:TonB-dependent SusC/RagA subfamily outer membrane receptor